MPIAITRFSSLTSASFMRFFFFSFGFLLAAATIPASGIDFEADIKPVLEAKCLGCHNPNIKKGDLSFSTREEVLDPETELVVPGKAGESDQEQAEYHSQRLHGRERQP